MVTHMQVVNELCFKFSDYFRYGLQFYPYLVVNQEVIEEVVIQLKS